MNVDRQLEARILIFVVREFLDKRRATPRRDLILAFETEGVSEALCNLTNHSLLRRKDNVFPENYLPSAASFQFCDDERLRTTARTATILHALRRMFKANPGDRFYEFEELQREVRALYPDADFDEPTLRLGLYLAPDLNAASSFRLKIGGDAEFLPNSCFL
jgi:hypothetical protein